MTRNLPLAHNHHPPDRRRRSHGSRYEGPDGRGARRGNSGYGMESIRIHLRAQLELQNLLRPSYLSCVHSN